MEDFNFTENYRLFIESATLQKVGNNDTIIFQSWVNNFYLVVVDLEFRLKFIFGNIKEKQRSYTLHLTNNQKGYKCFLTTSLQGFPADFQKIVRKRGLVFNGDYNRTQRTTIQRLICCLAFDINGLHIHHIDNNHNNNHCNNLIPLKPFLHRLYHRKKNGETFCLLLDDFKKTVCFLPKHKKHYSSKKTDPVIFLVLYYRFVQKFKISEIASFKSLKQLSEISIKRILKEFSDFNSYYSAITS